MEKIQNFFRGIITSVQKTKKDYEKECEKMSAEEKQKESDKRMEAYKALCLGGLTSMYWKDTTALLNKVSAISGPFASVLSEGFAISQVFLPFGPPSQAALNMWYGVSGPSRSRHRPSAPTLGDENV